MTVVASRNGRWWIVYLKNLNMNELRMMAGAADLQPLWGLLGRASVYGLVGAIPALFVAIGLKSTVLALAAVISPIVSAFILTRCVVVNKRYRRRMINMLAEAEWPAHSPADRADDAAARAHQEESGKVPVAS